MPTWKNARRCLRIKVNPELFFKCEKAAEQSAAPAAALDLVLFMSVHAFSWKEKLQARFHFCKTVQSLNMLQCCRKKVEQGESEDLTEIQFYTFAQQTRPSEDHIVFYFVKTGLMSQFPPFYSIQHLKYTCTAKTQNLTLNSY